MSGQGASPAESLHVRAAHGPRSWGGAGLLALVALTVIVLVYHQTAWSIVSIWQRSQTFAHGFLVLPISAYLIWDQRKRLAALAPRPNLFGLLALGALGFGWLLAKLASVLVFEQYFLVAMIPAAVWTILGNRVARAIAFPLGFMLITVPFGEVLIPPLIEFTANFTVRALQLTGIPVYREGSFFTIPSGSWSVVEACSGLRYLIASFTLGCLYAYLTYRKLSRRLVFIALSVIVPIIANGIRAYLIVMIGHLSGMRLAVGVDHLIYGWIFFGIVMLLLFWIGSFWREHDSAKPAIPHEYFSDVGKGVSVKSVALAASACIAVALIWPAYSSHLEKRAIPSGTPEITITDAPGKWEASANPASDWKPAFVGTDVQLLQGYRNAGRFVSLYIGYYRNPRQGAKLISSQNALVAERDQSWRKVGEEKRRISLDSRQVTVSQSRLRSPATKLLVWQWYWLGGEQTASPYLAKAIQAKNRLLDGRDDGASIIVSAPYEEKPEEAVLALQDFIDAMMPAITKGLRDVDYR